MVNKNLFKTTRSLNVPPSTTVNEAGGRAYSLSAKGALAQYVSTGCLNATYYASAEDQLTKVLELARQVEPEFVAKCAVYARQRGLMKDMPALLIAYLSTTDRKDLFAKVFPVVIDSPKMLRNVVQILRSGTVGRKSLGSLPKKLVKQWLDAHDENALFRGSVGNDPSLADVIKMVHPKPGTPERDALYRYLLDKDYDMTKLPASVQAFESFKKEPGAMPPDVPFEMLTNLPLTDKQWTQIARNASWTQTRMNLNTFVRHGVFKEAGMEKLVAERLADPNLIKKAKVFPYQLMAAYMNSDDKVPMVVSNALQDAMEHAIDNIPTFNGKVFVLPDASGSMSTPVTGHRKGSTSKVSCYDIAGLFSAAILRKNPTAEVIPFGTDVCSVKLNPRDSVMTNAKILSNIRGGGTDCAAPLRHLNKLRAMGDICIFVSDNQSWIQGTVSTPHYASYYSSGTSVMTEWEIFKKRNPNAKLVCIDVQPYVTTQAGDRSDILNVGGFNDSVFSVVDSFLTDGLSGEHWAKKIESVVL